MKRLGTPVLAAGCRQATVNPPLSVTVTPQQSLLFVARLSTKSRATSSSVYTYSGPLHHLLWTSPCSPSNCSSARGLTMSLCNMRAQSRCPSHSRPFTSKANVCVSSRRTAVAVTASGNCSKGDCSQISNPVQLSRRDMGSFAASLGMATLLSAFPAAADGESAPQQYIDPEDAFKLSLPTNWQSSEGMLEGNSSFTGASGARRTIAWFPTDVPADQVNVTLTITNTSMEFTQLGSFGNVFAFGTNLVNSMDRSFLLRMRKAMPADGEPVQLAKLLDAKDTRGMYQLEYSVEKMPGPKRHLYSLVALAYNGRYNRLYTLTAQCLEDQVPQYEAVLLKVLNSFQPPAPATNA